MSEIQKWKPSKSSINKIKMEVSERGKYIKYSDYLAEIQRLQSIIQEMQQVDDMLAQKSNKELFNELKLKARMYEYVRRLNAQQFAEIYGINIKTGVHFDHLIIQAMIETK